jgi:DNA-binding beta-propeller fold protein YncE
MRKPVVRRRGGARRFIWLAGPAVALMTLAAAPSASAGAAASGSVAPRPVALRLVSPGAEPAARFGALRFAPARFDEGRQALARYGNQALARQGDPAQGGPAGPSVMLDGSPGTPAANPATGTVYVPIQCDTSFCPSQNGHTVDVINAAKCNAKVRSDCRVIARAAVGSSPLAAVVDQKTDTVYVTNGNDGTVSVLNGARCNAQVTSGCGQAVATIQVGKSPVAAALNPATRTLYVATPGGGTVSVVNVAACNARTTRGCGQPVRTVTDNAGPAWIGIDEATDTVYVANIPPSGKGTVSVIDGAACNGHTGRGCGQVPATVRVGINPFAVAVDQVSDTIYVSNSDNGFNGGSVSVINGARCNGHTTTGCHRTPPAVPTGTGTGMLAVDQELHTVFAINTGDDTLSAINTKTCAGLVTSGCRARPPNEKAAPDQGPRYNPFPNGFALMQATSTAYVINIGGANILSVTGISCTAASPSGCRTEASVVQAPGNGFLVSADPATNTIYAANTNLPQIDVLNGATCRTGDLTGCAPVAKIPFGHPLANLGAVDHATHTLYAADTLSDTVSVINTATCNAKNTSGCAHPAPIITVGPGPGPPALNPVTRTLYVPNGASGNRVAVVNAATCNAEDISGCGQAPAVVKVGQCTFTVAVSAATDTVYAPSAGLVASGCAGGDTVSVINGATCNGTDHSGCGHLAATAKVGSRPVGAAVDDSTHSVYVINNANNGDLPGTLSVINGATCNGTDTSGCGGPFPTAPAGRAPSFVALDPSSGFVYVADFASAAVSVLNGSRCNAETAAGCAAAAREQPVGSGPQGLAVNPRTRTVYVADAYLPEFLSVFTAARR